MEASNNKKENDGPEDIKSYAGIPEADFVVNTDLFISDF
jgi:hypothetical protein